MKWLRRRRKQKRVARSIDLSFIAAEDAIDAVVLVAEIVAAVARDN